MSECSGKETVRAYANQRSSFDLWLATSSLVKVLDIVRVEALGLCRRLTVGREEERDCAMIL